MITNPLYPHVGAHEHYLAHIDANAWPGVVDTPDGFITKVKARKAEADFAIACQKAGLSFTGESPDLAVLHEEFFARLAHAGWLGVAEGFMAGEWFTEDLPKVLAGLIRTGYRPRSTQVLAGGNYTGKEIPLSLVRHYSGDGMSTHGTVFASGVPTTERVSLKSYVPGAGRANEPSAHFVDITHFAPPTAVERADLQDAQLRSVTMLLDRAHVGMGSHIVDYPSSGGALPLAAAARRATVDVLSADADFVRSLRKILEHTDVDSSVHIELLDDLLPKPKAWPASYDAITSVEKLELMGQKVQREYVKSFDRLLAPGGYVSVQTVITTDAFSTAADRSLDVLRAYVAPGLHHLSMPEVHKLFDVSSQLRVIAQTHVGSHYLQGLRMQREIFEGKLREAAADGYDQVYRRLWVFQLALKEALFEIGALDAVQLTATTRKRRGRR